MLFCQLSKVCSAHMCVCVCVFIHSYLCPQFCCREKKGNLINILSALNIRSTLLVAQIVAHSHTQLLHILGIPTHTHTWRHAHTQQVRGVKQNRAESENRLRLRHDFPTILSHTHIRYKQSQRERDTREKVER